VEVVDIPANNKAFMKAIIFSQELGRDHQDFYFCFKVVSVLQTGVEIIHLAS
jgi:hypothetical protein